MEKTFGRAPIQCSPLADNAVEWRFETDFSPEREALPHYSRPFCLPVRAVLRVPCGGPFRPTCRAT
ncbi:hypothetical protein HS125_07460 [bacterium]|nr:hypothetical protein [bacterium]